MKRSVLLLLIVLCALSQGIAQQPVTIPGSALRTIQSTIVNQEYALHISLPRGYAESNKKYPVIYLMDSQWDFPLVTALYGEQYYDGFVPEVIIVGVTWGGTNPKPDSLRARDYTPTKVNGAPQSGGATTFLSFMRKELFPFIESNYKADKDNRVLMGCSLGGLFTLYALFTEPDLFKGYVAASPAFGWDNEVLRKYEQQYFDKKDASPKSLFVCMGGVERSVPGYNKLVQQFTARNYKNIKLESRVLENIGHSGTKGEGYERGMQWVFKRPELQLDVAVLNQYVGKYGNNIEFKNENNQLAMYFGPTNKLFLYASNATDFYSTSEYFNVRFKIKDGKVEGYDLEGFNGTRFISKNQ
jgi:predicted alpha/beta superfamily hydrolase